MPRIVLKEVDSEITLSTSDTEAAIGRDPTSAFVVMGPNAKVVSARHARIFHQDNAWWIADSSRNGTIVDDERLQQGQRHALRVGQVVGLGESGPRYRVVVLDSRMIAETVNERPNLGAPAPSSAGAPSAAGGPATPIAAAAAALAGRAAPAQGMNAGPSTMHSRPPADGRADIEESTEPMSPAPDWLVQVALRFTKTNQTYDVRAKSVKIGRSTECNVQVPPEHGAAVSRMHAEITIHEGGVVVRDEGSRNGTYLNNRRLESSHPVMRGDVIMLGAGGPSFAIDDLHIVRGPGTAGAARRQSPQSSPAAPPKRFVEPPTAPAPHGAAAALAATQFGARGGPPPGDRKSPLMRDVIGDVPAPSARRRRIVVWAVVAAAILVATLLLIAGR